MEVANRVVRIAADVEHEPVSAFEHVVALSDGARQCEHRTDDVTFVWPERRGVGDVPTRDNKDMGRSDGCDISKGDDNVGFGNDFGRACRPHDLAEDATWQYLRLDRRSGSAQRLTSRTGSG